MLGEVTQLARLFTNLIVNALHYTSEGGINIRLNRVEQSFVVEVQDTGIGIASEDLVRVFDRFWRADRSRTYWQGGSGLGLAIAQSIAQSHGGTISVNSQVGMGSCFNVRFPAIDNS